MIPCNPGGESARIDALHRYDVLDTAPEEAFDRITRLARNVLQMPFAMISLVDRDRIWFKSKQNVPAAESPRAGSFCTQTIAGVAPFVVSDARNDPRFADNPAVAGKPHIRYYIGIPLRTRDGHNIGSLCVLDTNVRVLTPQQVELLSDLARLVVDELELRLVAAMDSLTGAMTRRRFLEVATADMQRVRQSRQPLGCIMFDMDRYKSINDIHGHHAGDLVLQHMIALCHATIRASDYIGRIGGEEFAIMLPDTGGREAFDLAERLRIALSESNVPLTGGDIRVTASFGVAELNSGHNDMSELLRQADLAMYAAKLGGRNRTVAYDPSLEYSATGRNFLQMSA
jgi:diguanylate cyclase (GGDEF)-like protein